MKKPLRALFYGMTHEHAPGKIATLRKLTDDFEVVAVVDDRPPADCGAVFADLAKGGLFPITQFDWTRIQ